VLDPFKLYQRLGFAPHARQVQVLKSGARFDVVCAGRRWGKSLTGPHKKVVKMFLRKPTLGWVVAPTYDLGEKEFRVFWHILVEQMKVPVEKTKTFYNVRTKDFRITTQWGASVEVRSAEHPDSLVGEGLDWVIMAEAAKLKQSHWEKNIRPALADKRGDAIFVSTPEGYNWFYDLWKRGQSRKHPDWWSIKSPTWENTTVFPGGREDPEIVEAYDTLAEQFFMQEYGAEFTSFAGRIYSEFDEGYHVIDEKDWAFHPEWDNYMGVDFGFRNPFVALQVQRDPQDNLYVWSEYYEAGKHIPEHARNLKSEVQWKVDEVYYDPSGVEPAGGLAIEWNDTTRFSNQYLKGVTMTPAENDWAMGVSRVKDFLQLRDEDRDGVPETPKLYVISNCTNTIREFNTYRVKEQTEKMDEKQDPKEEPRKKDDHCMDALRYLIVGLYGLESHYGYQA
jgi:Terminase RNaseH-like domain/Terminase large subunit, T4likevirus-type, N-terminal